MGNEKQLQEQLIKSNESLEKAGKVIEDLKNKLENNPSTENHNLIEKLEKELAEKDTKINELAQSVAITQPPPRRVKLNLKYSNKYTPTQLKAFKKNGISIENLDTEPEPADIETPEIEA